MKGNKGKTTTEWARIRRQLPFINQLASDGLSYKKIADIMSVNYQTFKRYIVTYKELADALQLGRETMARNIENKLYQAAMGNVDTNITKTTTKKVITEYIDDETGILLEREDVITNQENIRLEGNGEPDVKAAMFLLKGLKPEVYNVNATSNENVSIEPISIVDDIPDGDDENKIFYDDSVDATKED